MGQFNQRIFLVLFPSAVHDMHRRVQSSVIETSYGEETEIHNRYNISSSNPSTIFPTSAIILGLGSRYIVGFDLLWLTGELLVYFEAGSKLHWDVYFRFLLHSKHRLIETPRPSRCFAQPLDQAEKSRCAPHLVSLLPLPTEKVERTSGNTIPDAEQLWSDTSYLNVRKALMSS